MKFLRAIGVTISSFLSSILTLILVLILTVSLTVISLAHAVNEKTVQSAMSSVLQNEEVRQELSKEISGVAMTSLSDIIRSSTSDPDKAEEVILSLEESAPVYIDEFLAEPAVQELLGNVVSDFAMAALSNQSAPDISLSSQLTDLFTENSETFDEKIEKIITEQEIPADEAREKFVDLAAEFDVVISEDCTSYSEVIAQIISASSEEIDGAILSIFSSIVPTGSSEDLTNSLSYHAISASYPMLAVQFSFLDLEVNLDEDQAPMEMLSQILTVLKHPIMYALLAAISLVFFIVMVIFCFNFRRPFFFMGLTSIITGILLILVSKYPIPFDQISALISTGNPAFDAAIPEALAGAWSSASSIVFTHAATVIILGILFIAAFVALRIKRKKKLSRA